VKYIIYFIEKSKSLQRSYDTTGSNNETYELCFQSIDPMKNCWNFHLMRFVRGSLPFSEHVYPFSIPKDEHVPLQHFKT